MRWLRPKTPVSYHDCYWGLIYTTHHDPLCRIAKAVQDDEHCPDHPLFGFPCQCGLIAAARRDGS